MEAHNASLGGLCSGTSIRHFLCHAHKLDVLAFGGYGPSWVTNMAPLYTWLFNLLIESCFHRWHVGSDHFYFLGLKTATQCLEMLGVKEVMVWECIVEQKTSFVWRGTKALQSWRMGCNICASGQCHFATGSHPFVRRLLLTGLGVHWSTRPKDGGIDAGNFHVGKVFMETWQVELGLCRASWSHDRNSYATASLVSG